MNVSDITHYLNIALTVLFVVVLVSWLLFFLRGLLRGWRYGTYRVIAFAVLVAVALLSLGALTDAIGNWDMESFGIPDITISLSNGGTAVGHFGTPYGVASTLIEEYLKSLDTSATPEQVSAYALSLAKSIVMVIVLGLDGFLLATFGNLFVMLLWHIAFIHIIPKDKREEAKHKGRLISAFEELVVGVVIGSMMLFPFTSLVHSFTNGWNTPEEEEEKSRLADNTTYTTVQQVVDTYNDSIFAKVFFSWSKDSDGLSYDMALTNFFTRGNYDNASVSVINELTHLVRTGSYLVEGGVLSEQGIDKSKIALFAVSQYAPLVLRSLAKSNLLTGLMPYALQVVSNMPAVAKYLKTDAGINFQDPNYQYDLTLTKLADIYEGLIENKAITSAIIDENGNLNSTPTIVSGLFSADAQTTLDSAIKAFDDENLRMFSTAIQSAVYVLCCNSYKEMQANPTKYEYELTLNDFFPSITATFDSSGAENGGSNGIPDKVPTEFTSIKWGDEILSVYDSIANITKKDTGLIGALTANLGQSTYSIDTKELMKGIVNHLDAYASSLFGVKAASGVESEATATSEANPCLLDSTLIERALPKILKITANSVNTSFKLTGSDALDLTSLDATLFPDDMTERIASVKAEFQNLYTVVEDMVSTDEAKALLLDLDNLPGIYFDPEGSFLGINKNLLTGFAAALKDLDKSLIANTILPKVFQGFLQGDSSPLASLGLGDLQLDFSSNVGTNLSSLLTAYGNNQEVVSYLMSNSGNVSAGNADTLIKSLLSYKDSENTPQLTNILKALITNPIINPAGTSNANIKSILKVLLGKLDLTTTTLTLPDDLDAEMDAFVGVLQVISEKEILSKIVKFSSLSTHDLSVLASIDFTALFTKIQDSKILTSILGTYLDDKVLANISYLSDAAAAGAKFANVTDWAKEGAALDALIKAANEIGDLGNIDYFKSDPQAITNILKALAGSQIFQGKDANGNPTYLFPSYMAGKLVSSFVDSADYGTYFVDPGVSGTITKDNFTRFTADFTAISTVNGWTDDGGEADKIGAVLTSVLRMDGLNFINDSTDWRTINRANVSTLLDAVATSESFGPILTYHLYEKVATTLGDSASAFQISNVGAVLEMTTSGRKAEVKTLSDILSAAIDPSYGLLDSAGQIQASSITLNNVSADFLLDPLLTGLSESKVFNTAKTGESTTAFKKEVASLLNDSSLYSGLETEDGIQTIVDQVPDWNKEITRLCNTVKDIQSLNLPLDNIASYFQDFSKIDAEGVTSLLASLVQSTIFNVSSNAQTIQTFAQKTMTTVLLAGDPSSSTAPLLSTYYFNSTNPKDIASGYADSTAKAKAVSKNYFALGKAATNIGLITGDTNSIKSILKTLQTGGLIDALKAGNVSNLGASEIKSLLRAFNSCDLYQDCVPNVLAETLSESAVSLTGINLNRADPFYCYYWDGNSINLSLSNPDFTAKYDSKNEDEIERIGDLLVLIRDNKDLLNNLSTTTSLTSDTIRDVIKPLLYDLEGSYVFHKGQAFQGSHTLLTNGDYGLYDDLSVFEQMMFMIYDESKLDQQAYDISYDNYYYTLAKNLGGSAYQQKLYDRLTSFEASSTSLSALHSGDWLTEIDNLTITNTSFASDPGHCGVLNLAVNYGFLNSGVSGMASATEFETLPPEKIEAIGLALNGLDLVKDAVPYSIAGLIEGKLDFSKYSVRTESAVLTSSTQSFDSKAVAGDIGHYQVITVASASEPTVSVSFNGVTYKTLTKAENSTTSPYTLAIDDTSTLTVNGNVYTYDINPLYPVYFTVSSSSPITQLDYTFNTSDFRLSQQEFEATGVGVIKAFADAIWDGSNYLHFDDQSKVSTFLLGSGSGKIKAFLDFIASTDGFYYRHFYTNAGTLSNLISHSAEKTSSFSFASRDVTISALMSFSANYGGSSVSVSLGKYLGSDVSGTHYPVSIYAGAEAIFNSASYDSQKESDWMAAHQSDVCLAEAVFTKAESYTVAGKTLPRIQMIWEGFGNSSEAYSAFKNALTVGFDTSASYVSLFGKAFASGLMDELVSSEFNYENGGDYFRGLVQYAPTSLSSGTNRLSSLANPTCPNYYESANQSGIATDLSILDDFLSASKELSLISALSSGVLTLTATAKTTVVNAMTSLDATLALSTTPDSSKLLAKLVYLGAYYDDYLNRSYFHGSYEYPSGSGTYVLECDFFNPDPLATGYANGGVGVASGYGPVLPFTYANAAAQILTA